MRMKILHNEWEIDWRRWGFALALLFLFLTVMPLQAENTMPSDKISIEEAFTLIGIEYGVHFNYDRAVVADVEVDYDSGRFEKMEDALQSVFSQTNLKYEVFDQRYVAVYRQDREGVESMKKMVSHFQEVISSSEEAYRRSEKRVTPPLASLSIKDIYSKRIVFSVSGIVTDQDGEPLIGVNIQVKGSDKGTSTDFDGRFVLEDISENAVIVVSYVGYQTQEVDVVGRSNIEIVLLSDAQLLDEIVVVGYGEMKRSEITNSVVTLNENEFIQGPVNNPLQMLDGKISGLSIGTTAAGDPNAGSSVQIRGVSSVNAGTGPLVVIDGVPGGDLNIIPRSEIETISVLKDGASAAIYGARGANGVIIVTTKKGTKGAPSVTYDTYIANQFISKKPDILNAEEYVAKGRSTTYDPSEAKNLPYETDWYDLLLNKHPIEHYHNLGIGGGSEYSNYRIALLYRDASGVDISSRRREYAARLNFSHQLIDIIDVFGNLNINRRNQNNTNYTAFRQAIKVRPTDPLIDPENPNQYQLFNAHDYFNPVALLEYSSDQSKPTTISGDINFKWNVSNNFNTTLMLSEYNVENLTYGFLTSNSRDSKDNKYSGRASRGSATTNQKVLEWLLNYYYDVGSHSLKALGGYSFQKWTSESFSTWNADFASDALLWNNLGSGRWHSTSDGQVVPSSNKSMSKLAAFFGRVSYDYKGLYFLSGSLRREGSSKFGINNKWGLFPGLSAGWLISDMGFFKPNKTVNSFKVRSSYGSTGRQEIDPLLSISNYSAQGQYNMGEGGWYPSYGPSGNVNPDLKWEVAKLFNVGLDLLLFDESVFVSLDLYNKRTDDLLFQAPVPKPPNLYGNTWLNIGSINNKGVEMLIDWTVVRSSDLSYNVKFVGDYGKSKLLRMTDDLNEERESTFIDMYNLPAPGIPGPIVRLEEGKDIGSFHMYRHAGIDNDGEFLIYNRKGEVIKSTEKVLDDKAYVGNGIPDFQFSWDNMFSYKNFDLSLYFKGVLFWDVVNLHQMYFGLQNASGNVLRDAYERNNDIKAEKEPSSYFMEKGDYLSLRNASLGYSFSINNSKIKQIRLYLSGRNVFTVTSFTGLDPTQLEVNGLTPGIQGLDFYPVTRTFSFGANVKF